MVTLRQKVFFASGFRLDLTRLPRRAGTFIPRPFGRGETTPRRESPEGPPNVVAIKRAWAGDVLFVAMEGWRCLAVGWGDWALLCADFDGCEVDGFRSEPVSSEEPPLCHLAFGRVVGLLRLLLRACFCGVVSPARVWAAAAGAASREDDEVRSEEVSAADEAELARGFAWDCGFCRITYLGPVEGAGGSVGAPLLGGAG
jgi:hypothetical protein